MRVLTAILVLILGITGIVAATIWPFHMLAGAVVALIVATWFDIRAGEAKKARYARLAQELREAPL